MEFLEKLLPLIFMMVVIPALGLLTVFIVQFIDKKKEQLKDKIKDEQLSRYVSMLLETVRVCVVATNQTYVNALKEQGRFDLEAQKEAFRRTYDAVMSILSEEAVKYLTEYYGDLTSELTELIESEVATAYNREYMPVNVVSAKGEE